MAGVPLAIEILWLALALLEAWSAFHSARRDPRSTAFMKIALAGLLLAATCTVPFWLRSDVIGEGVFAHFLLIAFWTMITIGVPICPGLMVGTLLAMYKKR